MYTRRPLEWFIGRNVKMAFQSATSAVEYMWVNVKHVDGDELVGALTNEPSFVENLQLGDTIRLRRTQIVMVVLSLEEWMEDLNALLSEGDYFNRLLGYPKEGEGIEIAHSLGHSPRIALDRWRDWDGVGSVF